MLIRVQLYVTPWTVAHQASLSMGFSRQECWSRLPFPPPGGFYPGMEPAHWQVGSLPLAPPRKTYICGSDRKESACNAGDLGLIPGLGRSSGEGNGNPLQYSCLENPMDREAWKATVHGIARVRHNLVISFLFLSDRI